MSKPAQLLGKTNLMDEHPVWFKQVGKYYMVEQPELIRNSHVKHRYFVWHRRNQGVSHESTQ